MSRVCAIFLLVSSLLHLATAQSGNWSLLASASGDCTIRKLNCKSEESTRVLEGHTEGFTSVCSLPDGLLASASTDKTIRLWNSESGTTLRVITGHTAPVFNTCPTSNGSFWIRQQVYTNLGDSHGSMRGENCQRCTSWCRSSSVNDTGYLKKVETRFLR